MHCKNLAIKKSIKNFIDNDNKLYIYIYITTYMQ